MKTVAGSIFSITAACLITIIAISCNFSPKAKANTDVQNLLEDKHGDLEHLKIDYSDSTNVERILTDTILVRRLKALMNDRYDVMKRGWASKDSIRVQDNFLIASGCNIPKCKYNNFIVVVDFYKDIIYAGIRLNGFVEIFSEDGSANPEIIKWKKYDQKKDNDTARLSR